MSIYTIIQVEDENGRISKGVKHSVTGKILVEPIYKDLWFIPNYVKVQFHTGEWKKKKVPMF